MKRILASSLILSLILTVLLPCFAETANDYVRLPDGVTAEMLCPEYWLSDDADRVLMTSEEIAALPENDLSCLLNRADELSAEFMRSQIIELGTRDPEACYLNGCAVTADYLDALMENANPEGLDPAMPLRYGYSVRRASLRRLPTNDFLGESPDDLFYDQLASSECMPFLPVIVVHESLDGLWYFVWFYGCGGWVEKENIALCPSRGDWLRRQTIDSFLLVSGRELRLNVDRGCDDLSALVLPMGTRLPLLTREEAPGHVSGRESFMSYVVKLPVRGSDGMIADEIALIPMSCDVHTGYLPYTSRNVLNQAFKLLGDRYGWAGLDLSNDCSGIVREIFRCFGIELPRASGSQAQTVNGTIMDLSSSTVEEKKALISGLLPGSLLYFPGHIMIYLNTVGGVPYALSSVGSFATEDMEPGTVLSVNTVCVNSLLVHRRSGSTWLDDITRAISFAAPSCENSTTPLS